MLFEADNLRISIGGKEVIRGVSMKINEGELHAVMGPNGSGKSTLCYGIMGRPGYAVTGKMMLEGKEISGMAADSRARLGLFLAFQNPQEIAGVNVLNVARRARMAAGGKKDMDALASVKKNALNAAKEVGLPEEFIQRDINAGFSGGEKKRMEMLQMKLMSPKLVMIDEIDSGLDIDGLKAIANSIRSMADGKRGFLVITHFPRILKYLKPDFVHVMHEGKIVETGGAGIAERLEKEGYEKYAKAGAKRK